MKLSVLILTHKRPHLFTRAINSVLLNRPEGVEIIVNNDTRDITEVKGHNIEYHYENDDDISKLYQLLFEKARGEYIYYLEDDDYTLPNFYSSVDYKHDIYYLEYLSKPVIETNGMKSAVLQSQVNKHLKELEMTSFVNSIDYEHFQLGQILFKHELVKKFPTGNVLHNDKELFIEASKHAQTFKYIDRPTWMQTLDGCDNISYPTLNTDSRFKYSRK